MNTFIYICIVFLFVIIQTSGFNLFLPSYICPDLMAVFVVFIAMTRRFREGLLFIFLATYLLSLHSSLGFLIISTFAVISYAIARYVSLNFYTSQARYLFLSIALPVFANKFLLLAWLRFGSIIIFTEHLLYVLLETIITAALGVLIFKLFMFIDLATGRINLESVVQE